MQNSLASLLSKFVREIRHDRDFIDLFTAKTLASALVLSHLDYGNAVLYGLPDKTLNKLQRVQNWAAKVVLKQSKYDSSKEALRKLHWLPIKQRIHYKLVCLVYKCLHKIAPPYLCDLLQHRTYTRQT